MCWVLNGSKCEGYSLYYLHCRSSQYHWVSIALHALLRRLFSCVPVLIYYLRGHISEVKLPHAGEHCGIDFKKTTMAARTYLLSARHNVVLWTATKIPVRKRCVVLGPAVVDVLGDLFGRRYNSRVSWAGFFPWGRGRIIRINVSRKSKKHIKWGNIAPLVLK